MGALSASSAPAAADDLDAARLFERYGDQLYRFCFGRLRSREEAEDAVQNTFLRVHTALRKGVVPRFEAAWLYKIAHNVCLTRREAAGRRARVETPSDLEELEYALPAPAADHDELAGLAEALAGLPHNLRQSILLREWQGLSYAEIATAMGTTVPAVETLLYRARRELAATLESGGKRRRGRSLAGLLDALGLRGLLARLRDLFAGAGPAKLAAGAALVAIGGAGIGTAVTLGRLDRPVPSPARAPAAATTPRFAGPPAANAAGSTLPARPARPPAKPSAPGRPPASVAAPVAAPPVGLAGPTQIRQSSQAQPSSPVSQLSTTSATVSDLTSTLGVSTPAAPTLTAPTASLPSVSTPQLDASAVESTTTAAAATLSSASQQLTSAVSGVSAPGLSVGG